MAVPVRSELLALLGELGQRSASSLARRAERSRERLDEVAERLPRSLGARAGHARADLNLVAGRLRRDLLDRRVVRASERLAAAWQMVELVHPDRPLRHGFARVTARDGNILTSAAATRTAKRFELHFADGSVPGSVDENAQPKAIERKRRRAHMPPQMQGQPGLFDPTEE
jgi:exodeoxyribonuclease VII large subunit